MDGRTSAAAINLPIAFFYAGRYSDAVTRAEDARMAYPDAPQPPFVQGLSLRAQDKLDAATEAFQRVLELDPDDVGARVNLAVVLVQQRRYDEAIALCDAALLLEPYNATAAYNRALALTRSGRGAEGARAMDAFNRLRTAPFAVTYSQTYLQQGRYAEAVASTGTESGLVDLSAPTVSFVDATQQVLGSTVVSVPRPAVVVPARVALADLDDDGQAELIVSERGVRVLGRRATQFEERAVGALGTFAEPVTGLAAGDVDHDNRSDLLVLTTRGPRLFVQDAMGGFVERGVPSLSAIRWPLRSAALLDVDHDGDLDFLFAGGPEASNSNRLLRNRGDATFDDVTTTSGVGTVTGVVAVAATDFDRRRDVDVVLVGAGRRPALLRNLREGAFEDVAPATGLPAVGPYSCVAAGDVNQDGFTDLFLGRRDLPGVWALSDGRGRFVARDAPRTTAGASSAIIADFDNDGLQDLLVAGRDGIGWMRNVGTGWQELANAPASGLNSTIRENGGVSSLAAGDVDADGDLDLVLGLESGAVRVGRNEGGNRNRSLAIRLGGRVSNRAGIGAKVEMRAGSSYQSQEFSASIPATGPSELLFGLGGRETADMVRVLWPSGVLQAEAPGPSDTRLSLLELDRAPSSCPFLFSWNGNRFEFVTDFLGAGEMGYWEAPGHRSRPDPEEYVRLTDAQLQARSGRFELRVANELEEVLYADAFSLFAIDHDDTEEVYPDEGMRATARPFTWVRVKHRRGLLSAVDEHGHDVGDRLEKIDGRSPDDFERHRIRGYAREHVLTVELPAVERKPAGSRALLLTGWTDYAFSSDNVAAHQAGLRLTPPVLQAPDGNGGWRTVITDVGVPVGRPQTLVVDLTPVASQRVRLVTNMQIYWDRIAVADVLVATDALRVVPMVEANLRWRGFSAAGGQGRATPLFYDYDRVNREIPWKLMPGRYTRLGDAVPLVRHVDDRLAVAMPGDELALVFDATALPPVPAGRRRTFLLKSTGYSKEMDLHSASPDEVGPLPYRSMSAYPYSWPERYPHADDLDRYHTRRVVRSLATLIPGADQPAASARPTAEGD